MPRTPLIETVDEFQDWGPKPTSYRLDLPLPDDSAVPVAEWPREIDEPVLIFVEHPNLAFATGEEQRDKWRGWFRAQWTDFNGGGWIWFGMLGTVTHVMPDIDDPRSPHFKGAEHA